MEMLFADMECDPAKNALLENDVELTPEIIAQLNESQQSSVRMAVKSKVSVIVGPPGTGKSRTLAGLIAYLVLAKEERVALVQYRVSQASSLRIHTSSIVVASIKPRLSEVYYRPSGERALGRMPAYVAIAAIKGPTAFRSVLLGRHDRQAI